MAGIRYSAYDVRINYTQSSKTRANYTQESENRCVIIPASSGDVKSGMPDEHLNGATQTRACCTQRCNTEPVLRVCLDIPHLYAMAAR